MNCVYCYTFIIVLFSILFCVGIHVNNAIESRDLPTKNCRYTPAIGWHMPFLLFILCVFGYAYGSKRVISLLMPMLSLVSLYDCILLLCLPLLRKYISPRVCAVLWQLPYAPMYLSMNLKWNSPNLVIHIPGSLSDSVLTILTYIWLAGFVIVLLWHILSHIIFRITLLKDAHAITDATVLNVWHEEQQSANYSDDSLPLVTSSRTQTPLSIGLLRCTTYVVLPERDYKPEELSLLFRHELVHIARKDSIAKLFMSFLTSVFWFNPLMWLAMRCCADDLELSCDETVLLDYDSKTRQSYAKLLLQTAADNRGFTTCLSASAKALRYRLNNVIAPKKRLTGGVIIGLIFCLLALTNVFVDFDYDSGVAEEKIFRNQSPQVFQFQETIVNDSGESLIYNNADEETLIAYLFHLPVSRLAKQYNLMDQERYMQIKIHSSDTRYFLIISEHYLRVYANGDEVSYCLGKPLDWQYLLSLMQP